jgi:sterol 24-C-methyltransferase
MSDLPISDYYSTLWKTFPLLSHFLVDSICRLVSALECLHIAPRGTTATSSLLMKTAVALVEGGKLGIFSPMYLIVARKPETHRGKQSEHE